MASGHSRSGFRAQQNQLAEQTFIIYEVQASRGAASNFFRHIHLSISKYGILPLHLNRQVTYNNVDPFTTQLGLLGPAGTTRRTQGYAETSTSKKLLLLPIEKDPVFW